MSGVDGGRSEQSSNERQRSDRAAAIALIQSLYVELAEGLRAVAWDATDPELLYVRSTVETPWALRTALRRRNAQCRQPLEDGRIRTFEYSIDAYEGVMVVMVAARAIGPPHRNRAIALSVERNGVTLRDVTTAIERALMAYCARQ